MVLSLTVPSCPISVAMRLPRFATSFGLDTLSVRPLSRDAPEGCQGPSVQRLPPKPLSNLPPVLSSLEFGNGLSPDLFEGLVGSRRPSPLWRDRSIPREVFTRASRGDRHL